MNKNLCIALMVLFGGMQVAAAETKIGYVNVEKILSGAPQVEAVNTAMTERFGSKKDELQSLENEIKESQENFKRNELVMTEDKLNELKADIIGKMQSFKQKEALLAQEVSSMRNQELAVLQSSIRSIINEIAEKDKFDLVLSEGVVFAADKLDISDQVLEKMTKSFKKK